MNSEHKTLKQSHKQSSLSGSRKDHHHVAHKRFRDWTTRRTLGNVLYHSSLYQHMLQAGLVRHDSLSLCQVLHILLLISIRNNFIAKGKVLGLTWHSALFAISASLVGTVQRSRQVIWCFDTESCDFVVPLLALGMVPLFRWNASRFLPSVSTFCRIYWQCTMEVQCLYFMTAHQRLSFRL